MRLVSMSAAALFVCAAVAQSPLTTTFASSTFLAATTGVTVYFDLNVRTAVQVQQMDVNFYGAAGSGVRMTVQSAVLAPGVNALGAITSNGVELLLDVF